MKLFSTMVPLNLKKEREKIMISTELHKINLQLETFNGGE